MGTNFTKYKVDGQAGQSPDARQDSSTIVRFVTCRTKPHAYCMDRRLCLGLLNCWGFGVHWWNPKVEYTFELSHLRYTWSVSLTWKQLKGLLSSLRYDAWLRSQLDPEELETIRKLMRGLKSRSCCEPVTPGFMERRGLAMMATLQELVDIKKCWEAHTTRDALCVSAVSFNPSHGEKPLEVWGKKDSGGFHTGYSRRIGDYISFRRWRWFAFHPNQVVWYRSNRSLDVKGVFHVNAGLKILRARNFVVLMNDTRVLRVRSTNSWETTHLYEKLLEFYKRAPDTAEQPHKSSFPARSLCDARVYTVPAEYFAAAAVAMLSAKYEIFIASWKNTPRVLMTRPPLAPMRLDQLLALKAAQGVKVYVLLYKEVEISGQGNDSALAMGYLEGLHPNIQVLRHPNKFVGGSTAIMWSHHEKLCCVDRNVAFVGGIDMAIGRWDDHIHSMVDPDGLKYPGKDYRQPAEKMHCPAVAANRNAQKLSERVELGRPLEAVRGTVEWAISKGVSSAKNAVGWTASDTELLFMTEETDDVDMDSSFLTTTDADDNGRNSIDSTNSSKKRKMLKLPKEECRDKYPRTGWHDMHCCVSGTAARDVAAHFVERWQHHRLSIGATNAPQLKYISTNTRWASCPFCRTSGIFETDTYCPRCSRDLGPVSAYLLPPRPSQLPLSPDQVAKFSFVEFSCTIVGAPCFSFAGDAPVVVIGIIGSQTPDVIHSASILRSQGPDCDDISQSGRNLTPGVGDVLTHVDGKCVTHISYAQVIRLIKLSLISKQSSDIGDEVEPSLDYCFRRHNLNVQTATLSTVLEEEIEGASDMTQTSEADDDAVNPLSPLANSSRSDADADAVLATSAVWASGASPAANAALIDWDPKKAESGVVDGMRALVGMAAMPSIAEEAIASIHVVNTCKCAAARELCFNASKLVFQANQPNFKPRTINDGTTTAPLLHQEDVMVLPTAVAVAADGTPSSAIDEALASVVSKEAVNEQQNRKLNIATTAAEIVDSNMQSSPSSVPLSSTAADRYLPPQLANFASDSGSMHVQVLRSVGGWSVGKARKECSIANAWCQAIQRAQHLVYIENQFFIGNCGNENLVENCVPNVLLERVIRAACKKETFRAIILIPQHPQGDVAFSMRPRIILHYQLQTINKGINSMIGQFNKACPGVNWRDYMEFYCLHNYGVLHNQFVHDQIYIHDKFLCVDDRVLVVGSANINDRSMLGERDSEVAVRLEDVNHCNSTMGGTPFTVGCLPHDVRMRLMRQHLGDMNGAVDVSDPLRKDVYDGIWRLYADRNAGHYSAIDGSRDVFAKRNATLENYRDALLNYTNPTTDDENVRRAMDPENGIQGTLLPWPMDLFCDEDLSPSVAIRTIVPSKLWV